MGRPATAPRKLKDGFYIEVCAKGARNGIKIWCQDEIRMLRAAEDYRRAKDVIVWGEHINGKWASEIRAKKQHKEEKKALKEELKAQKEEKKALKAEKPVQKPAAKKEEKKATKKEDKKVKKEVAKKPKKKSLAGAK